MTKIEEAKFERCASFLADMIMKYADEMLEMIEQKKE